ncbi:hypothetical protein [Parachryseolinea silvisoli]|jgi:hypothetical protein|uniref:hypothetical protein n=1 Tax=Parachryseolinea silvisoli TaxID=2873601 RepID=UPI002265BB9F|nr:hypothetical protein [Parachryseolinea silvisoli]MCD9018569.1 hypothetical protein [Parachryseolinea silvisoli]
MKYTLTLAVLLTLFGLQASAQADYGLLANASTSTSFTSSAYTVSPIVQRVQTFEGLGEYHPARLPGERMRKAGRILTILGAGMLVGGIIVYNNADDDYYNTYTQNGTTYEEGDPQAALGILMMVGGTGMVVPGVILWAKGAAKYNRALKRQEAESVSMNLRGSGIALTYRF